MGPRLSIFAASTAASAAASDAACTARAADISAAAAAAAANASARSRSRSAAAAAAAASAAAARSVAAATSAAAAAPAGTAATATGGGGEATEAEGGVRIGRGATPAPLATFEHAFFTCASVAEGYRPPGCAESCSWTCFAVSDESRRLSAATASRRGLSLRPPLASAVAPPIAPSACLSHDGVPSPERSLSTDARRLNES